MSVSAMNPDLLLRALPAVNDGCATVEEFQSLSGIASKTVADDVLEFLHSQGIGKRGRSIEFSGSDRLDAALLCIRLGCDVEQVSKQLRWQDFERLASETLRSFGYKTRTNVRLTKPRMEIDVLGVDSGLAIAIDCKHWKRNNLSSLSLYARKQVSRTREIAKRNKDMGRAIPAILTLHAEAVKFIDGVPIVPVSQFRSFVMDVRGFLSDVCVIYSE
jgi:hypothetical protein